MHIGLKNFTLATVLALCACGAFPRDPEGTLDRVRERGTVRIGVIAGGADDGIARAFIRRMARATGARPVLSSGAAEPLLLQLEAGDVDLVVGTFDEKSPWVGRVTVGPPLRWTASGKVRQQLAPAMRNGENAWVALVEREVRDLAAGAS